MEVDVVALVPANLSQPSVLGRRRQDRPLASWNPGRSNRIYSFGVSVGDFYDELAQDYHLVYHDWYAAIKRQHPS